MPRPFRYTSWPAKSKIGRGAEANQLQTIKSKIGRGAEANQLQTIAAN